MKKSLKSLVSLFCTLLLLLLCACQPAVVTPDEPESIPESSIENLPESSEEESRTLAEIAKAYRADVDGIIAEYEEKLNDYTLKSLEQHFKTSLTEEEYVAYSQAPNTYLDERVRPYFDFYLDYRTHGAKDAPIAPEDYNEACRMIREEFKDEITDENRAVLEELLVYMENDVFGMQNPTPYSDSPQLHFDMMRLTFRRQELRVLWPLPDLIIP